MLPKLLTLKTHISVSVSSGRVTFVKNSKVIFPMLRDFLLSNKGLFTYVQSLKTMASFNFLSIS